MLATFADWFGRLFADSIVSRFVDAILTGWRESRARADAMKASAEAQRAASANTALDAHKRIEVAGARPATRESTQEAIDAGKF